MTLQVPVRPLLVRKFAKINVFSVKIAKTFFQELYQNLGEPLITIAIFRFLQKQRGQLLLLYERYRSKITLLFGFNIKMNDFGLNTHHGALHVKNK